MKLILLSKWNEDLFFGLLYLDLGFSEIKKIINIGKIIKAVTATRSFNAVKKHIKRKVNSWVFSGHFSILPTRQQWYMWLTEIKDKLFWLQWI